MGVVGQQFGAPSGLLGRLAGRFMARNNADVNRRLVDEVASLVPPPRVVAELGFGPGVGLTALLSAFPLAQVLGVDPSLAMAGQASARNRAAVEAGRLRLMQGDASALAPHSPIDLIVAVHVLYFWQDPVQALGAVTPLLRPGGHLALGYQLKQHMPPVAQRDFVAVGHRLYESDDEVTELLSPAGLNVQSHSVIGGVERPVGRLLLASRN
jgi:trans-aconitate methyltransferase